jgi:hypothetical protein
VTNISDLDVWVIRHKETKEIIKVPSGKTSWRKQNHAKSAWLTFCNSYWSIEELSKSLGVKLIKEPYGFRFPKFDEQYVYELASVKSLNKDLFEKLQQLCEECIDYLPEAVKQTYITKLKEITND